MSNFIGPVNAAAVAATYGSAGTTRVSNSLTVAAGSTLVAFCGSPSADPTSVVASTGETLTKLVGTGKASIWAVANATGGSTTVTATWGSSVMHRAVTLIEVKNLPTSLTSLDTATAVIASGTLATLAGLQTGASTNSIVLLYACSINSGTNQPGTFFREYLAQHHFAALPEDGGNHGAYLIWVGLRAFSAEAVFPASGGYKDCCAVVLQGTAASSEIATLNDGRGAEWISAAYQSWSPGNGSHMGWLATGGNPTDTFNGAGFSTHIGQDGYLDRFAIRVRSNTLGAGGQFVLKIADGNGGQSAELSAHVGIDVGVTGWIVADAALIDFLTAGTFLEGIFNNFGSGGVTIDSACFRFTAADGTSTITRLITTGNDIFPTSTPFMAVVGPQRFFSSVDRAVAEALVGHGFTAKNLRFYCNNNPRTQAAAVYLHVNGANSALKAALPAGTTGWFDSGVLSATISPGDAIVYKADDLGTDAAAFNVHGVQMDLVSTQRAWWGALGQQGRTANHGEVHRFSLAGDNQVQGNVTIDTRIVAPFTFEFLGITVAFNSLPSASTLELYKGGVATGALITIPGGTTGKFTVTGSIAFTSDNLTFDDAYLLLTAGSGSGAQGVVFTMIYWGGTGISTGGRQHLTQVRVLLPATRAEERRS